MKNYLLLFIVGLWISTNSIFAQSTYYVNDNDQTGDVYTTAVGNDATGDGSKNAPFATITKAITDAVAGDTIYVDAGTYNEGINVNKGVLLQGLGMDLVLINGNSFISGDSAIIDGCHIKANSATTHGIQIYPGQGAKNVVIKNSRIETQFAGKAAIYVETFAILDGFTLENNEIIGDYGVTQSFGALNTTIKNNKFTGISGSTMRGIQIKTPIENVLIENNDITGFAVGIRIDKNSATIGNGPVVIKNNFVYNNSSTGLLFGLGSGTSLCTVTENFIDSNAVSIQNNDTNVLNASANWLGDNTPANVAALISGDVDYTPWFESDNDLDAAIGSSIKSSIPSPAFVTQRVMFFSAVICPVII
jgi:hypothetical protein